MKLTDEEIKDILVSIDPDTKRLPPGFRDFARAIEAALSAKQGEQDGTFINEGTKEQEAITDHTKMANEALRQAANHSYGVAKQVIEAKQEPVADDIGVQQDMRVFARIASMKKRTHPANEAKQEPVAYDKTEMNAFVQTLYDQKMREGRHGHYETMFHVVHQAIKRALPAPSVNAQALTEEQIAIALENLGRCGCGPYEEGFFDGVAFAEKHHGIAAAEGETK